MGGSNDPTNIIEITIKEHAEKHKELWEKYNKKEDYIAWKCLSGKFEECEKERVELSKLGFKKFLKNKKKKKIWIDKIKKKRKEQIITNEHKRKISNSLIELYKNGKRKYVKPSIELLRNNIKRNKDLLSIGRKNSIIWKHSVTSEECKLKKRKSSTKSVKIMINNITYDSIRHAAKESLFSYFQIRKMIKEGDDRISILA